MAKNDVAKTEIAKIEQSTEVSASASAAYQQLCRFEDYPQFMDGVQAVSRQGENRLQWTIEKNGKEQSYEAEITDQVQDKLIAWRSTSGVKQSGRISLQTSGADKTRVTMSMETEEAATGDAGKQAKQKLERDLQRFKETIEAAGDIDEDADGEILQDTQSEASQQKRVRIEASADADFADDADDVEEDDSTASNQETGRRSFAFSSTLSTTRNADSDEAQQGGRRGQTPGFQSGQSRFSMERNMSEQSGSMQFSGETTQSRSPSQQQGSNAVAQIWAQPARMMSQVSEAFGQMPARMLEQEASMMQRSFGSPQVWLPNVMSAWEEPFVMMRKISEEMDQFFGKVMQRPIDKIAQTRIGSSTSGQKWTPCIEVTQRNGELLICADLPGLTKDDVQLQVLDDKLTIEGERCEEGGNRQEPGYHRTERSYGHFYRAIPLPDGVDRHRVDAKMRDGVLEITLPLRQKQPQGLRLEIREADEGELREQQELRLVNEQMQQRQPQRHQQQGKQAEASSQQDKQQGKQQDDKNDKQIDKQQDKQQGKSGSVGVKAEVQS